LPRLGLIAALIGLGAGAIGPNLDRLRSMPVEMRTRLAANLERFDRLPDEEQAAIRALDKAIEALPDGERRRYLDLMDRYANWVRSLPEDEREILRSTPPDERLETIRQFRADDPPVAPIPDRGLWSRSPHFNPVPLYEATYLLRVWVQLDERQRRDVERQPTLSRKVSRLSDLGRRLGTPPSPEIRAEFTNFAQEVLERVGARGLRVPRLNPDQYARWLLDAETVPEDLRGVMANRFREQAQERLEQSKRTMLRLMETRFIPSRLRASGRLSERQLAAFEARLPKWYRATLDPLPPDVAAARVQVLRDLVERDPILNDAFLSPAAEAAEPPSPIRENQDRPAGRTLF